jgi:hypothetical protein
MRDIDLGPDPLPAELASMDTADESPQNVAFVGWLGESHEPDHVRLYLDEELRDWFDVHKDHVVRRERRGSGDQQHTVLWLDRRDKVKRRQAQTEDLEGDYLTGPVAAVTVEQSALIVALDVTYIVRTIAKLRPACPVTSQSPDPAGASER